MKVRTLKLQGLMRKYRAIWRDTEMLKQSDIFLRNKRYARTGRERCIVCFIVGFWYHFDRDMPHYCWTCSNRLHTLYRGKQWDDTEDIPF